ncbi:hypothetical protein CAPTEDRAFT_221960 [Capitella teleta]|uniref:Uncharacterized protein n=1 Tax=Capitella teleta TaxID=283909 RepID=R7VGZ4_CAPTE|nr:hypothetical protein CAPTEDRAFT_221960 [Capitella teleta]|eukprot:ELU17837.1 hypothetical protein CAPTEDRAFT_221960 [Capitella teleta]
MQHLQWPSPHMSPDLSKRPLTFAWSPIPGVPEDVVPSSRSKHASCLHGNKIYVYGGKVGNFVSKELWTYNLNDGIWKQLCYHGAPPPSPQEHSMVAYKGTLFVFGAEFNFSQDAPLWMLDLNTLHWKRHTLVSEVTTPESRRGHSAVVCNSGMHIFGGYVDLKGSSQELWTFDLENLMWHLTPASEGGAGDGGPGGRHDHSAVMYDGRMYIFGGMNGLQTKDELWSWNFSSRKWTKIRCHRGGPPPMKGHCACRLDDTMLVFGGSCGNVLHSDLWSFHFSSQTWTRVVCSGAPPSPRSHLSCLVTIPSLSHSNSPNTRTHSVPFLKEASQHLSSRPYSSPANCNPKEQNYKKKKSSEVELYHIQLKNKRNVSGISRRLTRLKKGNCNLWSSYGSLTSTHDELPLCCSSVDSLQQQRSVLTSSLDSLLDMSSSREWIQPRSYSREDLILEDIEDSEDNDLLDNSRSELLLHTNAGKEQPLCRCNAVFNEAETSFITDKLFDSKRVVSSILPTDAWIAKEKPAVKISTNHVVYPSTALSKPVMKPLSYCIYFIGGCDSDSVHPRPLLLWKLTVSIGAKKS